MITPCTERIQAKPIPSCVSLLTLGSISVNNTSVQVRFQNVATDRIKYYSATSSNTGIVFVDLNDTELLPRSTYIVTVEGYDLTIDGNTESSVVVPIEIWNDVAIDEYTLEAA
jgi:hypothetical protein